MKAATCRRVSSDSFLPPEPGGGAGGLNLGPTLRYEPVKGGYLVDRAGHARRWQHPQFRPPCTE